MIAPAKGQETLIRDLLASPDLSKSDKLIIRWQFGRLGDFETALMKVIALADESNLELLERGFFAQCEAYRQWTRGSMGQRLRSRGLDL